MLLAAEENLTQGESLQENTKHRIISNDVAGNERN
jgi:hypothetical protein